MRARNHLFVLCLLLLGTGVSQGAFQFAAWADNRPYDSANRARFRWALNEMNRIAGSGYDFHIVPGDYDYTYMTDEDVRTVSSVHTWHYAPGNHDPERETAGNWSMDWGNAHFVFLNEYCTCTSMDANVCDHIYNWLVNDLNGTTQPAIFVVGHEPAFPENRHVGESLDQYPQERDRFWSLLNERKVLAYICGHTHVYSTYSDETGPTVQIDMGNAGNPSLTGNPQTFAIFDVTDLGVDVYVYDSLENEPYTGGYSFSMPIPSPADKAQNPSPADKATGVPTNAVLSWTAGTGAASHDVHLWKTGADPSLVSPQQTGTSYAATLEAETPYSWRIDEHYDGKPTVQGDEWSFTTKATTTYAYAESETTIDGSVAGSGETDDSDDAYESITEELNVPNKNGYSTLEHMWRFSVQPGNYVELHVEAFHTPSPDGDDCRLSYSTDGVTYTSMLTLAKTADNDAVETYSLPSATSGTVHVKVEDTDSTRKAQNLDTLYVDLLCIVSSDNPIQEPVNYKATNPSPASGATGVATAVTLTWTPGDEATAHNVYFGNGSGSLSPVSGGQSGTSYTPGALTQGATYYWRIDEVRAGDLVETGTVWSFTTASDPGTPTTMTASVVLSKQRAVSAEAYGVATVTVVDNLGNPVSGAVVKGMFTGDFAPLTPAPKNTDTSGKVVFTTEPNSLKAPKFGFDLISVTHGDLTWEP